MASSNIHSISPPTSEDYVPKVYTHPEADKLSDSARTLLGLLKAGDFFKSSVLGGRAVNSKITQAITSIKPQDLREALAVFFAERSSQVDAQDPMKVLDQLAELIPLEKLQDAIRTQHPTHISALQTAQKMLRQAHYYLEKTETKFSPSVHARLTIVFNGFISILEMIMTAFGIPDFFKPAKSEMHAQMKAQHVMALSYQYTMFSAMLIPFLGEKRGAYILGITQFCIVVLSLVYPHIKPFPFSLPKMKNWSLHYQLGQLEVAGGRKAILAQMAQTLIASKKVKKHVMLLGETGVGKTQTVKDFAAAVERGDYPELKGKKVFYANTADLMNNTGGRFDDSDDIFEQISQKMGCHRDNIILVLDEIHLLCQSSEEGKRTPLGDQLKSRLDNNDGNYPYVIGMTTEVEYFRDIYRHNPAFARRFKRINIDNTTPKQTLEILNNIFLQQAPKTLAQRKDMEYLLERTIQAFSKHAAQPATAINILTQCIQRTAETQKPPSILKIEGTKNEMQQLDSKQVMGDFDELLPYDQDTFETGIEKLQGELEKLKAELGEEEKKFKQVFQTQETLFFAKREMFRTVLKVSTFQEAHLSPANRKELNSFLLLSHFLSPALETQVRVQAKEIGVKVVIDRALIDEVIQEEVENNKKVAEAVEKGKAQNKAITAS
jgi:ATP-dependent Clp protease ATP-binding subunit ClpA